MKNTKVFLMIGVLIMSLITVTAETPGAGLGIGIDIDTTADTAPYIWMDPDTRIFRRNPADGSGEMIERINNYVFCTSSVFNLKFDGLANSIKTPLFSLKIPSSLLYGIFNPVFSGIYY